MRQGPGPAAQGGHHMAESEIQAFDIRRLDAAGQTNRLQHRPQRRPFPAQHLGVHLFERPFEKSSPILQRTQRHANSITCAAMACCVSRFGPAGNY